MDKSESGGLAPVFKKQKMINTDFGNSFLKFKKQFVMATLKTTDEIFNETYNMGIDASIRFIKSQRDMYYVLNPRGNEVNVLKAVISSLEHFKKPFTLPTNDDLAVLEESYKTNP